MSRGWKEEALFLGRAWSRGLPSRAGVWCLNTAGFHPWWCFFPILLLIIVHLTPQLAEPLLPSYLLMSDVWTPSYKSLQYWHRTCEMWKDNLIVHPRHSSAPARFSVEIFPFCLSVLRGAKNNIHPQKTQSPMSFHSPGLSSHVTGFVFIPAWLVSRGLL